MKDIVPELLNDILKEFHLMVDKDIDIQGVLQGKAENATFEDVSNLAARIGKYASKCLINHYTDSTLPKGILYWNIAKGTIEPLMEEVHKLVVDMSVIVQLQEDEKNKIRIRPVRPKFNKERVEAVINKVNFLARMPEVPEVE